MTAGERMSEIDECRDDAAAYALGALEPEEAERFRRHLASCTVCRDEVAAFQPAAEALPMAAPEYPVPRALRRRVLRAVRAERGRAPAAGRPWLPSLRIRGFRQQPAAALAVLAVAALVAVAVVELSSGGSGGVRTVQASVAPPAARAELRLSGNHGELIVSRLPAPPPGRIYEVWVRRGRRPPSPTSALFGVTSTGAADVGLPGDLRGVSEVLVTPEPLGGSRAPTRQPVIIARLA
jgi:anti-sigma-K factor RskA